MRLPPFGQAARHLEQRRHAGGVVVRAVVHHALFALDPETPDFATAKVIVVGAEHHIFGRRICRGMAGRRQQPDKIAAPMANALERGFDFQDDARQ